MGSLHWDDHGVTSLVQSRTVSATLPVVLCAAHGGNAVDGDQSETLLQRPVVNPLPRGSVDVPGKARLARVNLVPDVGTSQLLEEIDRRLTHKCSSCGNGGFATAVRSPAAVVARFHRKYVDANRPLEDEDAMAVHPSCTRAWGVHQSYHQAIETAIGALESRFCWTQAARPSGRNREERDEEERGKETPRVLLLDVHGQCKSVDNVLIGTCNGKTADLEELNTPHKGFLWHLRRAFNPKERGRDGDVGTAAATAVRNRGEREGGAGGRGEGEQEEDRQGREKDAANEEATTKHVGNGTKNEAAVVVLPIHGEKEVAGYTGGYTVQRHARSRAGEGAVVEGRPTQAAVEKAEEESRRGSNRGSFAVDAVQLEFGTSFRRTPEARANAAEAVACAIFDHLQQDQTNWTP
ncbi:unnamed protein product [Ectocarpus sp. 6 AP-2014]